MDVNSKNTLAELEAEVSGEAAAELRQTMIEDHTRCSLCGTELKFSHQVDYINLSVREEAHCPSCHIQLRARDHILH